MLINFLQILSKYKFILFKYLVNINIFSLINVLINIFEFY